MDKKSIAILLVASSLTTSVFASSLFSKIISNQNPTPSIVKTHETIHQANRTYTDFSGTWMMNCGSGPMGPFVIENDANYISVDGQESRIGQGLQGLAEANEKYTSYEHNSFEWNANGSALILKSVIVTKDNKDNSAMQTDLSTFTLTMNRGQIKLDGKFIMAQDMAQMDPIPVHCVFTKK